MFGWGRIRRVPPGPHVIIAANLDIADLTEPALFDDPVASFDQMRGTAPLHVHLHDPLVLSGCSKHGLSLDDIHADGFLDIPVFAGQKPKRVGLIGCGWYGKGALFRLLQIAPVEVVSLCDVDKKMLAEAAEMVAARQASKKKPRTYGDYREMLKREQLDIVHIAAPDHWRIRGCNYR